MWHEMKLTLLQTDSLVITKFVLRKRIRRKPYSQPSRDPMLTCHAFWTQECTSNVLKDYDRFLPGLYSRVYRGFHEWLDHLQSAKKTFQFATTDVSLL